MSSLFFSATRMSSLSSAAFMPYDFRKTDLRRQPKLCNSLTTSNVDVHRLKWVSFVREEEKAISLVPENHWHL